jgi:acylphosphatase
MDRATVDVSGYVQGVGFRYWVRQQARRLNLAGHAENLDDGRVQIIAQGNRDDINQLLSLIEESPSTAHRPGTVRNVEIEWEAADAGLTSFEAW